MGPTKTLRDGPFGYEMHMGETRGPDIGRPWPDLPPALAPLAAAGAADTSGRVRGCYLHGLLNHDATRAALLAWIRPGRRQETAFAAHVESALDALADHIAASVNLAGVLGLEHTQTG